jgi:hypothetical protein
MPCWLIGVAITLHNQNNSPAQGMTKYVVRFKDKV